MALGGKRPGAGRPKGSPNKASVARQQEVTDSGLTPLDFMLRRLRDPTLDDDTRFEAAKAAAPFVHPKLSSVEAKVEANVSRRTRRIERLVIDPNHSDAPGVSTATH